MGLWIFSPTSSLLLLLSGFSLLSLTHTHTPFSFWLRKTKLLTTSPELPPSSDHRLKFLRSGLVISLMLLLAVRYRFHYCRSMQSPCEVGGGMEEEQKKGGMRASYSQIYQPAFACRKSSSRGLGCCWNSYSRKGLGGCSSLGRLKGDLKTFLLRTKQNAEFVPLPLFLFDDMIYLTD